jgi:hypothetical protein
MHQSALLPHKSNSPAPVLQLRLNASGALLLARLVAPHGWQSLQSICLPAGCSNCFGV